MQTALDLPRFLATAVTVTAEAPSWLSQVAYWQGQECAIKRIQKAHCPTFIHFPSAIQLCLDAGPVNKTQAPCFDVEKLVNLFFSKFLFGQHRFAISKENKMPFYPFWTGQACQSLSPSPWLSAKAADTSEEKPLTCATKELSLAVDPSSCIARFTSCESCHSTWNLEANQPE